jgi:2-polyprenyl-3-methyl-5-hydroxy-6-metoxy-1,4-benzoquinol methylase
MRTLYSPEEAEFLTKMEKRWVGYNREKVEVIRSQLGHVDSLLEIGCGSGQILKELARDVPKLVGVDEKEERLADASKNCPAAKFICAKAEELEFHEEFDVVLISQMLHEVKQFGTSHQMSEILHAIWNALKPGGRYFLLDHIDPGDGHVTIGIPSPTEQLLLEFKSKFLLRSVWLKKLEKGLYEIEKRDLQDFVTKTWSFNSPMEDMEMRETHASFSREEAEGMVRKVGFLPTQFITFTNIENDLRDHRIELREDMPWNRKFLLVSSKP